MASLAQATTQHRNQLLLKHYELARKIAYRMYHRLPQLLEAEDLVGAAVMGLYEAIDRYDPSRAVPFEAFAKHRIQGAIMDAIRHTDWTPTSVRRKADLLGKTRRELITKLGRAPDRAEMVKKLDIHEDAYDAMVTDSEIKTVLSLQAPTHEDGSGSLADIVPSDDDLLEDMTTEEIRTIVRKESDNLPDRERQAIQLHYYQEMKLKEVGSMLGVTESRACQLCKQGIKRLRKRLAPRVH